MVRDFRNTASMTQWSTEAQKSILNTLICRDKKALIENYTSIDGKLDRLISSKYPSHMAGNYLLELKKLTRTILLQSLIICLESKIKS